MEVLFFIKKEETKWSYGRLFTNWANVLNMELIEDMKRIEHASKLVDFIIADDTLSITIAKRYQDLTPKIIPYAQTLFGLNLLRKGKKGVVRRAASIFPFYITSREYVANMKKFNMIFANSIGTSSLLHHLYNIYASYVVYPGIDDNKFRPTVSKKKQVLIYASAPYLPDIFDPIDLDATKKFVNASKELGYEIHSFGRELPFNANIIQHVNVSTQEVIDLYSSSVVTFTPQPLELFGLVPVESMFCGTPVISTYYHEALKIGVNGEVFNSKNILNSIRLISELDSTSVRSSVQNFNLNKSAKNLLNVLSNLRK